MIQVRYSTAQWVSNDPGPIFRCDRHGGFFQPAAPAHFHNVRINGVEAVLCDECFEADMSLSNRNVLARITPKRDVLVWFRLTRPAEEEGDAIGHPAPILIKAGETAKLYALPPNVAYEIKEVDDGPADDH